MKKKVAALFLASVMSVSLVGCSNSGGGSTTAPDSGTTAATTPAPTADTNTPAPADDNKAEEGNEIARPEKIKIMVDGTVFTKQNARDEFVAEWERLNGIALEVIQPDHDAYFDVVGQTLASGEWPDTLILPATYYAGYSSEGVLWDMTDAWNNSELKASGRVAENVVEGLKMDGSLYGFSPTRGNGCVTYIKKAWLDNVGLDVPKNYEEYLAVCDAFTNGDPDGNGVDGDTYAVSAAGVIGPEHPFVNYLPEFYQDAMPTFYKKADGTWADGFTEDSMISALERLQEAYQNGYIDKEALTNGTSDCRNKFYEDKYGIFTYWAGTWATNLKTNLENNGLDGELIALEPIKEVGNYLERISPTWCITEKSENPEGVFKYLIETMLDGAEVQLLWTYGVEDIHWSRKAETVLEKEYAAGDFHMRESLEVPGTLYTKAHIDPALSVAPIDKIENPKEKTTAPEAKASAELFNRTATSVDLIMSTDEMSQYNGDLQTLKNEIIALVVTQGMSVADGMAKFESDGGANWSKMIEDSLNR